MTGRIVRILLIVAAVVCVLTLPVAAGSTASHRYWGGSQDAYGASVETGRPWVLRARAWRGAYTADLPLASDVAWWAVDLGLPTSSGTWYIGYAELRHIQYGPGEPVTWTFRDVSVGVRGSGAGLLAVEYDVSLTPWSGLSWTGEPWGFGTQPSDGRWFGYDISLGVRWEIGPGLVARAGFTDIKRMPEVHTAEHWDEWMQWSGPYIEFSYSW